MDPGAESRRSRVAAPACNRHLYAAALAAIVALLLLPCAADAATPTLEFVVPGHGLPVGFTTEGGAVDAQMTGFGPLVHCAASQGEGEITGPRSAVAHFTFTGCETENGSTVECKSENANAQEIRTGQLEAELVFIDQAKHEPGILMNPRGGTYIAFECAHENVEGTGPFLASVGPVNLVATSFPAVLSQSGSAQTPDEYETLNGEKRTAVPLGERGTNEPVPTGVETTITVHPSLPGEIKIVTKEEAETKQREEETKQREQKQHEEAAEAAKRHQEEEAAAALKKHQEEETAAALKKLQEEVKPKTTLTPIGVKPLTRGQPLARALRQCSKEPKRRRARCEALAHRRYGKAKKHPHKKPTTRGLAVSLEAPLRQLDF